MVLSSCSSDRGSDGLNGLNVSVLTQPDVVPDSDSASGGPAKSTMPVELAVLERPCQLKSVIMTEPRHGKTGLHADRETDHRIVCQTHHLNP